MFSFIKDNCVKLFTNTFTLQIRLDYSFLGNKDFYIKHFFFKHLDLNYILTRCILIQNGFFYSKQAHLKMIMGIMV